MPDSLPNSPNSPNSPSTPEGKNDDPNNPTNQPEGEETGNLTKLKVYGEERVFKAKVAGEEADRLVELAQKGAAYDKRMQEFTAEKQKFEEEKAAVGEALEAYRVISQLRNNPNDSQAVMDLAETLGLTEEDLKQLTSQSPAGKGKEGGTPPTPPRRPPSLAEIDPQAYAELLQGRRDRFENLTEKGLAKDPILGDYIRKNAKHAPSVLRKVQEKVVQRMERGQMLPGGRMQKAQLGPEVVSEAIQDVRSEMEEFGLLGDGPATGDGVGRAPAGGTMKHPAKAPDRVPVGHKDRRKNFLERLRYATMNEAGNLG